MPRRAACHPYHAAVMFVHTSRSVSLGRVLCQYTGSWLVDATFCEIVIPETPAAWRKTYLERANSHLFRTTLRSAIPINYLVSSLEQHRSRSDEKVNRISQRQCKVQRHSSPSTCSKPQRYTNQKSQKSV